MSADLVADEQLKPLSEAEDDFYVPQEICKDILSRLPIKSILRLKCVYKPWRDLIEGGDFATSYTPKPCLAFSYGLGYAVCDETFQPLLQFNFPHCDQDSCRAVITSANGLLLVRNGCDSVLSVCNPMTRECIELPPLKALSRRLRTLTYNDRYIYRGVVIGFGVSKLSGQYKILCVSDDYWSCNCEIYTLESGGGLWRSIATRPQGNLIPRLEIATFFNGNLHWLAPVSKKSIFGEYDSEENRFVCRCFNLETERVTRISLPHGAFLYRKYWLSILENQLCFCGILLSNRVVIWCMDDYGDDKSWIKKYVFHQPPDIYGPVFPLRVIANDDLLFAVQNQLFKYSKNTQTVTARLLKPFLCISSYITIYTPNFLSLKSMGFHNVQALSFD